MREYKDAFPRENLVELTVKTEYKAELLLIKMGKKELAWKLFDYVFPHRERKDVEEREQFELKTVFPIKVIREGDQRTLEELG